MDHTVRKTQITEEERAHSGVPLDGANLIALGLALLAAAPAPLAVKIVLNGRIIFQAAQDGTALDNEVFCDLKINTVLRSGHSSLWWHHHLKSTGRSIRDVPWADPMQVSDFGGGFPLTVKGQIVGAIGVSGLPHEDDHRLIVDALMERSAAPNA